jgi:histidinol phosphatase-like PHP family hydrolase
MRNKKIDLHLHTPASRDYRGPKEDKEYMSILEKCYDDDIHTIAITDHNTVKGYKKLVDLKKSTASTLDHARKMGAPQEYVEELKKNSLCFNSIHLIPGVELSVYPKLHLLFLFLITHITQPLLVVAEVRA